MLPVISVASAMPVRGARTTAVKNAVMPTTAYAVGYGCGVRKPLAKQPPEYHADLRAEHQHRREQSAGRARRVGERSQGKANCEYRRNAGNVPALISVCSAIASPPPASAGSYHANRPTSPPINAARRATARDPMMAPVYAAPASPATMPRTTCTGTVVKPGNGWGPKRRIGAITKAGDIHARTVLIEAAHSYRFPARVGRRKLTAADAVPEAVRLIAWEAQTRLCQRYRHMMARGKLKQVVVTAIARELGGFVWSIARITSNLPVTRSTVTTTSKEVCPSHVGGPVPPENRQPNEGATQESLCRRTEPSHAALADEAQEDDHAPSSHRLTEQPDYYPACTAEGGPVRAILVV
jgi:hypothetical protein